MKLSVQVSLKGFTAIADLSGSFVPKFIPYLTASTANFLSVVTKHWHQQNESECGFVVYLGNDVPNSHERYFGSMAGWAKPSLEVIWVVPREKVC